jgi:uncharacterized protein
MSRRKRSKKQAMPTVVITGATGLIGQALVEHFSGLGWHVRALVRNPGNAKKQPFVTYYHYSFDSMPQEEVFSDADYLIHAAYAKKSPKQNTLLLNVNAAKNLLQLSRRHKLKRNIFLSSMSAHDDAVSEYGKQKLAVEKLFSQPQDTVVRLGLALGNGGLAKQLVSFMRSKHLAPLIDGGDQPIQFIAIYDLVRILAKILNTGASGILVIGTPQVYTYREFYLELRQKLQIKTAFVVVPFIIPLLAIRLIHILHLPLAVNEDNLLGLKKLQAFDTLPSLSLLDESVDDLGTALSKLRMELL